MTRVCSNFLQGPSRVLQMAEDCRAAVLCLYDTQHSILDSLSIQGPEIEGMNPLDLM